MFALIMSPNLQYGHKSSLHFFILSQFSHPSVSRIVVPFKNISCLSCSST